MFTCNSRQSGPKVCSADLLLIEPSLAGVHLGPAEGDIGGCVLIGAIMIGQFQLPPFTHERPVESASSPLLPPRVPLPATQVSVHCPTGLWASCWLAGGRNGHQRVGVPVPVGGQCRLTALLWSPLSAASMLKIPSPRNRIPRSPRIQFTIPTEPEPT